MSEAERVPRVLVIDDHAGIREVFATALEIEGFAVVQAGSGQEGLDLARELAVDAILLDTRMPGLDGYETLAALRAHDETRLVPVIMVSGLADVSDRIAGLDAGAADYLVKPVDPDELVARVRAHLRERSTLRRSLEHRLKSRAKVAELLSSVETDADARSIAEAVCRHVLDLEDVRAAAIAVFASSDRGEVLGASGNGLRAGDPLPTGLTRRLVAQAGGQGWVEHRRRQPAGAAGVPLAPTGASAAAYAPFRAGDLLGLLVLVPAEADRVLDPPSGRCLSTAIDLAPIVAALLSPVLARQDEVDDRKARLASLATSDGHRPVFQPIVDLATGVVQGFEALTRFADGSPPATVFNEAQRLGMGPALERSTALTAVKAAHKLPGGAWLSVNVSPPFLAERHGVADALADADRPIVLELTEHDPIDDYTALHDALEQLGGDIRLSVDDAGSGYACLTHVLALRPAYVKLDRAWVASIEDDPARQALVAGLGSFASEIGSTLIAEGVERDAEHDALSHLRVPLGQGFLYGRPAATRNGRAGS